VKLLLDENLSHRVLSKIADLYPGSSHIKDHSLIKADDEAIWTFAKQNDFAIVSKDSDFHQRSLVRGHPPNSSICGLETAPLTGSWKFCAKNTKLSAILSAEPTNPH
jgi:predicted nuclease of predicted toxin-antitoxin system